MFLAGKRVILALFFQVAFTGLPEHCVHYELSHGRRLTAEWTLTSSSTSAPAALQTGSTESVFAEKHHGLLKNLPAYRAGEVISQGRVVPGGHCVSESPALMGRFI